MTDREERRAAAIERGAQGITSFGYSITVGGAHDDETNRRVAAAVLDASGLLDDDEPPPVPLVADESWLDTEGSLNPFRKVSNTGEPNDG